MTTVKTRRGELRSRVPATLNNQTVDGIQALNRHSTRFDGGGGSGVVIYHEMRSVRLQTQEAVSCSGGMWAVDPAEDWRVWGIRPADVMEAYRLASIYRKNNPGVFDDLTAADLLYAAESNPHGCVGGDGNPYVWGNKTLYEDSSATVITEYYVDPDPAPPDYSTGDTWTYPGGRCGGEPWAGNPNDPQSMDDPGWALSNGTEQWSYEWYPLVLAPAHDYSYIAGGPVISELYGIGHESIHTINCNGIALGLPEFIKNCPRGTVVHEALLQVEVADAEWLIRTGEAASATAYPTVTTASTSTGDFNLMLMGEVRSGSAVRWVPLGGGIAGTATPHHSTVIDATSIVQRLLELSGKGAGPNTSFAHFALLPNAVASLSGSTDARGILRSLAPIPTMAWDSVANAWYCNYAQARSLQWTDPSLGNLVLTFSYPAGEVQRAVIPDFWPALVMPA